MHRIAKTLLLSTLLASASTPCMAVRPTPIPVSGSLVGINRLPESKIRLGKVTVLTDIAYASIPGYRPMLLDLYLPAGKGPHPLVVYVHGGSWTSGSKRVTGHFSDFPGLLARLAEQGFAVASVDYRLSSEAKFPAAILDVKAAVRFLRANSGKFRIDRNRVALWGASAGAHIAAMAAVTGDDPSFESSDRDNAGQSDRVQAFVGWYGPYDMAAMFKQAMSAPAPSGSPMTPEAAAETTGPLNFFGCTTEGCPPGVLEKGSPATWLDRSDPPALLIHGTADTTVSPDQSIGLYNRLKTAGVSADLLLIDRSGHSWTGPDSLSTADASRRAVAVTFDWLKKRLLK